MLHSAGAVNLANGSVLSQPRALSARFHHQETTTMHGTIRLPQLMWDVLVRASSYDEDEHQIDVVFTTGATVTALSAQPEDVVL